MTIKNYYNTPFLFIIYHSIDIYQVQILTMNLLDTRDSCIIIIHHNTSNFRLWILRPLSQHVQTENMRQSVLSFNMTIHAVGSFADQIAVRTLESRLSGDAFEILVSRQALFPFEGFRAMGAEVVSLLSSR